MSKKITTDMTVKKALTETFEFYRQAKREFRPWPKAVPAEAAMPDLPDLPEGLGGAVRAFLSNKGPQEFSYSMSNGNVVTLRKGIKIINYVVNDVFGKIDVSPQDANATILREVLQDLSRQRQASESID